MDVVIQLYTLN